MAHEYDPASPTLEFNENNEAKEFSLDLENFMKPEKVKSRWRRNSEMETQELDTEVSINSPSKSISEKDMSTNSKSVPSFELLEENFYLFERKRTKRMKEVKRMLCECSIKDNDEIGCQDQCLNRLLMIECGSRCATGEACSNRRFQKRLYAKVEAFKTDKKGWGLKVLEDIPRGNFVIEYCGEVLNSSQFKQRVKAYARDKKQHYYFMALKIDEIIDAHVKGNYSRFINHSCDPNCETQKWTVNGDLRIGFFAKRDIKAYEELTFDYQLERYGRQAQKCYCNSANCKGYIGASNEITVDINKKKEKNNKCKRVSEKELDDLMMQEEIQKLSVNGLRNKDETLMLARLMVRAEDFNSRAKLLDIILNTTEVACLRLFLDYHGLTLIWSYMADTREATLKTKILRALSLLPVPNKTLLLDSKVLSVVQKWASLMEKNNSDSDEQTKTKSCDTSDSEPDGVAMETSKDFPFSSSNNDKFSNCDINMEENANSTEETTDSNTDPDEHSFDSKISFTNLKSDEEFTPEDEKSSKVESCAETAKVVGLAKDLLSSWKDLKEVFRIPLLEKKSDNDKGGHNNSKSNQSNSQRNKQPTFTESKNEKSPSEEKPQEIEVVTPFRSYSSTAPSWKKYFREENRSYTEMKHREKRKNSASKRYHSSSDYNSSSEYSRNNDYQFSLSAVRESNVHRNSNVHRDSHVHRESNAHRESNIHHYVPPHPSNTTNQYFCNATSRPTLLPNPDTPPNIICATPSHIVEPSVPHYTPNVMFPPPTPENFKMPFLGVPPPAVHSINSEHTITKHACPNLMPQPIGMQGGSVVPMQVVPSDSLSTHTGYINNQTDYVCEKPVSLFIDPTFLSSKEPQQAYTLPVRGGEAVNPVENKAVSYKLPANWKTATDSDGNIYFYHMLTRETQWDPPQGAEEAVDYDTSTPTYDEPKEHKRDPSYSRRSHKKHSKRKSTTTAPADTSSSQVNGEIAKKIKELFRTKMSSYVVQCLNPYRKEDCKVGRIISHDDFKHLARKLTHFIMAKELKHCKNVEDLDANESVKLKAKDYIRKYMDRYGPVYRKDKSILLGDEG